MFQLSGFYCALKVSSQPAVGILPGRAVLMMSGPQAEMRGRRPAQVASGGAIQPLSMKQVPEST